MSKPKGLNFDRLMTPILLFFEIFVTLQTSFQCIVFSETIKKNTHKNQCIKNFTLSVQLLLSMHGMKDKHKNSLGRTYYWILFNILRKIKYYRHYPCCAVGLKILIQMHSSAIWLELQISYGLVKMAWKCG